MKRYLFVYHYYSDGFTWFVKAKNLFRAYRELLNRSKLRIDREFLKVYDLDGLNESKRLD